jgi:hypothetical protein
VVTWELAYLGATNMFAAGPGEGAVRTLVETDLKLDLIPISPLCPFVAAGVGYQVTTRPTIQDVGFVTPLAAGLDVNVDTVMVEARATARPTWWSPGSRSTWTAELALGSRF